MEPADMRSRNKESFVLFRNTTQRTINLYWYLDHNITFHMTLTPGAQCKTNTFTNHGWIFFDKDTRELMHVNHSKIFWPKTYQMPDPADPSRLIPCRKEIRICLPLRSLRDNCLWRIVQTLASIPPTLATKVIDEFMSIPNTLKSELKERLNRQLNPNRTLLQIH
ncbi:protein Vhl [Ceratitis capitata]|uniref:(Mediterranean fruit fly) hypothetical protein n=1 Tax=Ceratitis capitata TaxID=7213 RepID=W8B7U5_CERCA|nr:protein Vhl [Ceratitis capitata]CAD7014600.1 unnamed protein product [Ceratitis capitata]